jgi:glycogen debranching enzyme
MSNLVFRSVVAIGCAMLGIFGNAALADDSVASGEFRAAVPMLHADHPAVNEAYRIAIGDLMGNISLFKDGLLERPAPVILAGLHYDTPWTRDAAINSWNGGSLVVPDVARDTLLSVLGHSENQTRIDGQYWDRVIWATGAWHHYLYTGDKKFLAIACEATTNTLAQHERDEFDPEDGLFRGPGWSDGVAGYPDQYADCGGSSSILDWPAKNPDQIAKRGFGITMKAISTNCLYYNAYVSVEKMAKELNRPADPQWAVKAANLKKAINAHFWNEEKGNYRYLVGPRGNCDHQEGLGSAYAMLFGVADAKQVNAIFVSQHIAPAGIPCGWPNFPRYESQDGKSFGRHIGTVWPQIQGFWADAVARAGKTDVFAHELFALAKHACRDKQFVEIYHPLTGEIYGGLQENGRGITLWNATCRQTWSATAYLRMIYLGLVGMRFDTDGLRFQPCVPRGISSVELKNVHYRDMILDIALEGTGTAVKEILVNDAKSPDGFLPAADKGQKRIQIKFSNERL